MTREEKKEYLSGYLKLKQRIESLAEEYHFWEETAKSIPISRIEATGIHGSRSNKQPLIKHLDICADITKLQKQAEKAMNEIMDCIDELDNVNERNVLTYRYINGIQFFKIAEKMDYSTQHVFKLHSDALKKIRVHKS